MVCGEEFIEDSRVSGGGSWALEPGVLCLRELRRSEFRAALVVVSGFVVWIAEWLDGKAINERIF